MAMGMSIHIGLNNLDVSSYGEQTVLAGCINDADSMQSLAAGQGFQTRRMVDEEATADAVIEAISDAANTLRSGDMLFLTYSGHGSQVSDVDGDEADGLDETWCLYDRMLIDDELSQLWSRFEAGVRILMLSDSCHSGTVAKLIKERKLAASPQLRDMFSPTAIKPPKVTTRALAVRGGGTPPPAVAIAARPAPLAPVAADAQRIPPAAAGEVTFRWLDPSARRRSIEKNGGLYGTLQRLIGRDVDDGVQASVILISGCQDNQLSADGDGNGLFTETLLKVWNDGGFSGDYRAFHKAILDLMPSTQSPNYFTTGASNPTFEAQHPFTLTTDATNEPVASSLWVTGPETMDRSDAPPTFRVNGGPNPYFIFEITSEARLFDTGNVGDGERTDDNFYGSWSDSAHQSGTEYSLPQAVWDRLKQADTLYYRIGSTEASTGWGNYMVSTPDQQYDLAPSISLSGDAVSGEEEQPVDDGAASGLPSISGPDSMAADDPAPSFTIDRAGAPYAVVEVATDGALFADDTSRTDDNFYATWQDSDLLTGDQWDMPDAVWSRLAPAGAIYYRVGTTTSETGWDNYTVSTEDGDGDQAPMISVGATRSRTKNRPRALAPAMA